MNRLLKPAPSSTLPGRFLTFLLQLSSACIEASLVLHGAVKLSLHVLGLEILDHEDTLDSQVPEVVSHHPQTTKETTFQNKSTLSAESYSSLLSSDCLSC